MLMMATEYFLAPALKNREGDDGRIRKERVPDDRAIPTLNQMPGWTSLLYKPCGMVTGPAGRGCYLEESSIRERPGQKRWVLGTILHWRRTAIGQCCD